MDSFASAPHSGYSPRNGSRDHSSPEILSKTNVFIRGLSPNTSDDDLFKMCSIYGKIVSTKSITDRTTNECKGYGFVNFENPDDALHAVRELSLCGYQARMSKENNGRAERPFGQRSPPEYRRNVGGNMRFGNGMPNARPLSKTNLYLRGLDPATSDSDLHQMCAR